jgi:hypothetical protein
MASLGILPSLRLNKAPLQDIPLARQAYSRQDWEVLQEYKAEMRTRCNVEMFQITKKQKVTPHLSLQQQFVRQGFETNVAKRWRVDFRQSVGDCAEAEGFVLLRRAGYTRAMTVAMNPEGLQKRWRWDSPCPNCLLQVAVMKVRHRVAI